MANAIMKWTALGRSSIPDISTLPTRIQDIPKEVLRLYGIIIDSGEAPDVDVDDDDDDDKYDALVIDEDVVEITPTPSKPARMCLDIRISPPSARQLQPEAKEGFLPEVSLTRIIPPTVGKVPSVARKEDAKYIFKSGKFLKFSSGGSTPVSYCDICKKLVSDINLEEHQKTKHCPQHGCPDLILDEVDRARHTKIHSHPTKPFLCRWCQKRYRFYSNVQKHNKVCKTFKKAKDSWRASHGAIAHPEAQS